MANYTKNPSASGIAVAVRGKEGGKFAVLPMEVYAAEDMTGAGFPCLVTWNNTTKRLEASKAGGAGYTANTSAAGQVRGYNATDAKSGELVTIVQEGWFGNYRDPAAANVTSVIVLYVSNATAGVLVDTPPFAGALPVGEAYPIGNSTNTADAPNGGSLVFLHPIAG